MSPNVNPKTMLTELRDIASQIEATKNVDRERKQFAALLTAVSARIGDEKNVAALQEIGVTDSAIDIVITKLTEWGKDLAPRAETTWQRDEVEAKVQMLQAMSKLNMLDEAQTKELEELMPTITAKRGGSGVRGERTPQETIEGRAERVRIVDVSDGSKVAEQKGNVATSPTNLRQAASRYLEKAKGLTVDKTMRDTLLGAAGQVCKGEQLSVEVLGLRFEVAQ